MVTVISVLGIVVALAVAASLLLRDVRPHALRQQANRASVAKLTHSASSPAQAAAVPVPAQPRAANVRLDITADGRASWLEVRRGSATGRVLFTGELTTEQPLHLTGKRLWARFGAARNLTIRSNGKPIELTGTLEHVFVAAKR